jgi:hypothetical protein
MLDAPKGGTTLQISTHPECKEEVLVYLVECPEHVPGLRMFMEEHIWAQEAFTPLNTMSLEFGVRCFGLL